MAITNPQILNLLRQGSQVMQPSLLLGRSGQMVNNGLGWAVGAVDAGRSVGKSTETAVELGLAGAQGEPDPETGLAENIQDPTAERYIFVGNIACCPECARMSGMEVPAGVSILEISHPNCRCQIVPESVARTMLGSESTLPNPINPKTGVPYTNEATDYAIIKSLHNNELADRRKRFMGL